MAFDFVGGVVDQSSEAKKETHEGKLEALRRVWAAEAAANADRRTVPVDGLNGAWLVVITKAGKERSVHDRLVTQGFEVFLPLQPLCERMAQRRGVVAVPFFPRMLFARATLDAYRWQAIFHTIGVQRVMCDPAKPKGVTNAFVERLRSRIFDEFLSIGLRDPNRPAEPAKTKDRRRWVSLAEVVDGLMLDGIAERRESVLLSLLNEGHAAVTQVLRRR